MQQKRALIDQRDPLSAKSILQIATQKINDQTKRTFKRKKAQTIHGQNILGRNVCGGTSDSSGKPPWGNVLSRIIKLLQFTSLYAATATLKSPPSFMIIRRKFDANLLDRPKLYFNKNVNFDRFMKSFVFQKPY